MRIKSPIAVYSNAAFFGCTGLFIFLLVEMDTFNVRFSFVAITLLLLIYLVIEVARIRRVQPERWLLNPAVFCALMTFVHGLRHDQCAVFSATGSAGTPAYAGSAAQHGQAHVPRPVGGAGLVFWLLVAIGHALEPPGGVPIFNADICRVRIRSNPGRCQCWWRLLWWSGCTQLSPGFMDLTQPRKSG